MKGVVGSEGSTVNIFVINNTLTSNQKCNCAAASDLISGESIAMGYLFLKTTFLGWECSSVIRVLA